MGTDFLLSPARNVSIKFLWPVINLGILSIFVDLLFLESRSSLCPEQLGLTLSIIVCFTLSSISSPSKSR